MVFFRRWGLEIRLQLGRGELGLVGEEWGVIWGWWEGFVRGWFRGRIFEFVFEEVELIWEIL